MVKCGLKPMGDRALSFVAYSLDFGHAGDRLRYGSCVPSFRLMRCSNVAAYASQSHMFTKGNFRSRQPSLDRAAGAARPSRKGR